MNLFLDYTNRQLKPSSIKISGSKSESNRLLILNQFYNNLQLENLSDSDDTKHLTKALAATEKHINIGHAGTAMRFLTAYFAVYEGREFIVSGSERMHNRPIKILVQALSSMGCDIDYKEKHGFPPLIIRGKKPLKNTVKIAGNVSSQYISALVLIAPSLGDGLEIELTGKITSRPYLEMTLSLLKDLGIVCSFNQNRISIGPKETIKDITITVESDWSSASYFYSLVALSPVGSSIELASYKKKSLQGDSCLSSIYKDLAVDTVFKDKAIILTKTNRASKALKLDLKHAPDIAQTLAVTCFGLGLNCNLKGLHTLKIKETDRLVALKNELTKLGAQVSITDKSLVLAPCIVINKGITIATYHDHRMALAFAPLAVKVPLTIEDANVVTKSYTGFWKDLEAVFI